MSSSWLVRVFYRWKAWYSVEEAASEGHHTLDLRDLVLESLPTNLIEVRHASFEKNLFRLLLSHNQMSSLPGEFLHFLPHLRTLSVAHNKLRDLPQSVTSLENLTRLNLSYNNFTCGFPSVICTLRNLRILWANSVFVDRLPREINQLEKLRDLGLRFNLIAELSLSPAVSVNRIFLSHNQFHAIPLFPHSTSLVYLNLDDNSISQLPSTESHHSFNSLARLKELRYLSLRRNYLRVDVKLLLALNNLPKLVWCRLQGNSKDALPKDQSELEYRPSDHKHYLPDPINRPIPRNIIKNEESLISLRFETSTNIACYQISSITTMKATSTRTNDNQRFVREVGDPRVSVKSSCVGVNTQKTSIKSQTTSREEDSFVQVENWLQQLPAYNRSFTEGHVLDEEVPSDDNAGSLQMVDSNEFGIINDDDEGDNYGSGLLVSTSRTYSRDLDRESLADSPTSSEIEIDDNASIGSEISIDIDISTANLCVKCTLTV